MTYKEATEWLFNQIPNYQNQGGTAYKPGLERMNSFLQELGNPHNNLKIIHVAGTNGKGSVCHMLASVLQEEGYRVGVYSSPHVYDFRERIKINGVFIAEEDVIQFVNCYKDDIIQLDLSFFEITTALSFYYFAKKEVDFAVIEVGLGGRLDATNVVTPILSVITHISIDHTSFLGNTLQEIAGEKAGIIKNNIPAVVGENRTEVIDKIREVAIANQSELSLASHSSISILETDLIGEFQVENLKTVQTALETLKKTGIGISGLAIQQGLKSVQRNTKFFGRFTVLRENPLVIVDVAHNPSGIQNLVEEIKAYKFDQLHVVFGASSDKDVLQMMQFFPKNTQFYFCEFSNPRSIKLEKWGEIKNNFKKSEIFSKVDEAYAQALSTAKNVDCVIVCGSFFLLSDFTSLKEKIFR